MPVSSISVPFSPKAGDAFLRYAAAEGWITDRREIEFLTRAFPQGCLVSSIDNEPAAFITALSYGASAWIGNLLVVPRYRRQGLGRALMEQLLQLLDRSGCETVWLTASSDGAHLYRSLGFGQVDTIRRWRTTGSLATTLPCAVDLEQAAIIDQLGWGDRRALLFAGRQECTGWLLSQDGFLRCLPVGTDQQLGPWGALSGRTAGKLLEAVMNKVSGEGTLFLDVPCSNPAAAGLLRTAGFSESSSTLLMSRGKPPEYRPELVYSLASMGSYG